MAVAVDMDLVSGVPNINSLIASFFIIWLGTCIYNIISYFSDFRSVRACLRPGMYYVLVLMELQCICRMDTQGDKSLLDAWAEMR